MKNKIISFSILFITLIVLQSCSPTEFVQSSKFTTITNALKLQMGMSKADVVNTLGIAPYDLLVNQKDDNSIYVWNYKKVERKTHPVKVKLNDADNASVGDEVVDKQEKLYCMFDPAGKLISVVSDEGLKNAQNLGVWENVYKRIDSGECSDCDKLGIAPSGDDKDSKKSFLKKK